MLSTEQVFLKGGASLDTNQKCCNSLPCKAKIEVSAVQAWFQVGGSCQCCIASLQPLQLVYDCTLSFASAKAAQFTHLLRPAELLIKYRLKEASLLIVNTKLHMHCFILQIYTTPTRIYVMVTS